VGFEVLTAVNCEDYIGFEVLTTVVKKSSASWDITPWISLKFNRLHSAISQNIKLLGRL
jgi:hypothetical protein